MRIFLVLLFLVIGVPEISASDNFIKLRLSDQGDIYHILSTRLISNLTYEHKYFRSNNDYWAYTPGIMYSITKNLWGGPSAQIDSTGNEKLGARLEYWKLWQFTNHNISLYSECAHLIDSKDDNNFSEIFTQIDLIHNNGLQWGIQAWYFKEGEFDQIHLSPLRIGWTKNNTDKNYSITPFFMWRPSHDESNGWVNKYYFGIDLIF